MSEECQLLKQYIITRVLSVVPQGIDWISIIMKYWLPVTRQPLSTLHRRSVSIHSPELVGRGINALNYNKEEKRRKAKYNGGQRVARCALPISLNGMWQVLTRDHTASVYRGIWIFAYWICAVNWRMLYWSLQKKNTCAYTHIVTRIMDEK